MSAPKLNSTLSRLAGAVVLTSCLALTAACGGSANAVPVGADEPMPTSSGVQAAKAAGPIDTEFFSSVLPEGWEIVADDLDAMGLMTIGKKGTGGAQGVYLKFEQGAATDAMAAIEKFASSYEGSTPMRMERNGITWVNTRYTYGGVTQSLNITNAGETKVTFTVMGDDYDTSPGVKAIFDNTVLK